MGKVFFIPVSIATGLAAGQLGKKVFSTIWGIVDDEEAPKAEHRDIALGKLALALVIQGALFGLIRGLVDHGARHGYARLTGSWPGDEAPEDED